MKRQNLVIVRAGDSSLHPRWLSAATGQERNWDLIVNYFGNDPEKYRGGDWERIDSKGPKWLALYDLIRDYETHIRRYRNIWLPDDDLDSSLDGVNRLFEEFEANALTLAQPSLTYDSYVTHGLTLHNPWFRFRRTTFVEVMAPVFTCECLFRLHETFRANVSSWGIDYLWPRVLDSGAQAMAVIDTVQVRHTRPVGAANYASLKAAGKTPWDDMQELMRKHGITDRDYRILSATLRSGRRTDNRVLLLLLYAAGLMSASGRTTKGPLEFLRFWASSLWQQIRPHQGEQRAAEAAGN